MTVQLGNLPTRRVTEAYLSAILMNGLPAAIAYWLFGFEIALLTLLALGIAVMAARAEARDGLLVELINNVEQRSIGSR